MWLPHPIIHVLLEHLDKGVWIMEVPLYAQILHYWTHAVFAKFLHQKCKSPIMSELLLWQHLWVASGEVILLLYKGLSRCKTFVQHSHKKRVWAYSIAVFFCAEYANLYRPMSMQQTVFPNLLLFFVLVGFRYLLFLLFLLQWAHKLLGGLVIRERRCCLQKKLQLKLHLCLNTVLLLWMPHLHLIQQFCMGTIMKVKKSQCRLQCSNTIVNLQYNSL